MACEAPLISAIASLATIDLHTYLCKGCLEHQLYLTACPRCGQRELMLV